MQKYHLIGDGQSLPQQGGDHFHNGLVELREPLQLLHDKNDMNVSMRGKR